ncbi:MAG: MFS transporter [Roseococcus sp.]|nr:MFS transporter [Roseococcus sp.]
MSRRRTVLVLGTTQTLAWAGSYYLPAILAAGIARDLEIGTATVFMALSMALLLTAFLGQPVGRAVDERGGRVVLVCSNIVMAAGVVVLALAEGPAMLFAAWALLGVAMAMGLYDPAFATLARIYGSEARGAITGITLLAGFASTIGWPLTAAMEAAWGWRGACLGWAAIHLLVSLPLNLFLLPGAEHRAVAAAKAPLPAEAETARGTRHQAWLMAFVFCASFFTATALSAHLPGLLVAAGAAPAAAIAAAALLGPAQVAARVLEFTLLRRAHPLLSAKLASIAHPLGAVLLLAFGAPVAALFVLLHGGGNGVQTIVRGTLPLAVFGPAGYGARQGLIVAPSRFFGALAPGLFGLVIAASGAQALWLTVALNLAAFMALFFLRVAPASPAAPR